MGLGRSGEPARGLARQQDRRPLQAHERGSLSTVLDGTAPRRLPLRPAFAQRPDQAPDLWRALWRMVPGAQGSRRPTRRHARHPPPLHDRHCQFGSADQGRHEADGPQDRGDVHALRPHRGQAGAGCCRTGGESAAGHHGRAAPCGGHGMSKRTLSVAPPLPWRPTIPVPQFPRQCLGNSASPSWPRSSRCRGRPMRC